MKKDLQKKSIYFVAMIFSLLAVGCSSQFQANSVDASKSMNSGSLLALPDAPPSTMTQQTRDDGSKQVVLNGELAGNLYSALEVTGIVDASGLLGSTKLAATEIECIVPVVPNPSANCRLYTASSTLNIPPAEAAMVARIFIAALAPVNTGLLGSATYKALNISCVKVVYPGATPTCTLNSAP